MPEPSTAVSILKSLAGVPEPVVKSAVGFVESLLGEPLKVAGSAIADQVEMWKWQNRVRMAARAKEIMEEMKVAARIVPPSFLLPVIEAAGYMDDATLQDMWAHLLVSGVQRDAAQQPLFIRLLRDFSPLDARVFKTAVEYCAQGPSHAIGVAADRRTAEAHSVLLLEANGLLKTLSRHTRVGRNTRVLPPPPTRDFDHLEVGVTPLAQVLYAAVTRSE